MSGHSKWHNIQKTKGAADAKRAQAFTKIAREMIVAVKEGGGGDPRSNSKLAAVIAKAKAANMPNDNIKRTIDKALGAGNTENYEKIVYEGYGPQGVAVIVETMTDNRNRTAGEIRHYFDKYGGNMGAANCVSWSFDRKGVIVIDNEDEELDEDTVFEAALEAGADDVEYEGETITVYTGEDDVAAVSEALTEKGYKLGLVTEERYQKFLKKQETVRKEIERLKNTHISPEQANDFLVRHGSAPLANKVPEIELMKRPEITYDDLAEIDPDRPDLTIHEKAEVEVHIKYEGYIERQQKQVEQFEKLENKKIPPNINYDDVGSLRLEARQKLKEFLPINIGQASRLSGVTPADISVLLIYLEKNRV